MYLKRAAEIENLGNAAKKKLFNITEMHEMEKKIVMWLHHKFI
jgi:hypothetical protein